MGSSEAKAEAMWAQIRATHPDRARAEQNQSLFFDNIGDLDIAAEAMWSLIQVLPTRTNGDLELFYYVYGHPRNYDVSKRMHELHPEYRLPGGDAPTDLPKTGKSFDLFAFSDDPASTEIWLLPNYPGDQEMRCWRMSKQPGNEHLSWRQILQMAGATRYPNCEYSAHESSTTTNLPDNELPHAEFYRIQRGDSQPQ